MVDFSKVPTGARQHKSGRIRDRGEAADLRPTNGEGKLLTPKQIRARARRAAKRTRKGAAVRPMSELEFDTLYKPIEDWDLEELARGRPRNVDGNFKGRKPGWVTREVHERAMELFIEETRSGLGALAPKALNTLQWVLDNEDVDEKGKMMVPAAAKLQATHLVIEHILGKPKQRVESDISVKLQGLLAGVMVNPNEALAPEEQGGNGGFQLAHTPGITLPMALPGMVDEDDEELDDVS
jgi:hypothetical protein